jgi:hypothetical protein
MGLGAGQIPAANTNTTLATAAVCVLVASLVLLGATADAAHTESLATTSVNVTTLALVLAPALAFLLILLVLPSASALLLLLLLAWAIVGATIAVFAALRIGEFAAGDTHVLGLDETEVQLGQGEQRRAGGSHLFHSGAPGLKLAQHSCPVIEPTIVHEVLSVSTPGKTPQ